MAYLEFVNSGKGGTYVYISEYVGEQEYTEKKEARIFSLGRADDALLRLIDWRKNQHFMPKMIEEHFQDRLNEWIPQVALRVK